MRAALAIVSISVLVSGPTAWAADDAAYQANCASCHGAKADGDTPVGKAMKIPSLLTPAWAAADAPGKIAAFVRGSDKHQAAAGKLSAEDLDAAARALQTMAAAAQN